MSLHLTLHLCFAVILFLNMDYNAVAAVAAATPVTKFTNLQCESLDLSHLIYQKCRLKLIKRGLVGLNIYTKLLRPMTNIEINVDFYKRANGYKPFLFNYTLDFCGFQKKVVNNLPVRILFNFINQYSNLNHTCPYDHDIIVKDLILSEDKFRLVPLPSGEYMLRLTYSSDNIGKAHLKIYFSRTE